MSPPNSNRNRVLLVCVSAVIVSVVMTEVVLVLASRRAYVTGVRLGLPAVGLGSVLAVMGIVFMGKARSSRSWPMSTRVIVFVGPGVGAIAFSAGLLCEGFSGGDLAPATRALLQFFTWIGEASLLIASGLGLVSGVRHARTTYGPGETAGKGDNAK
jgi:hypothetical protein